MTKNCTTAPSQRGSLANVRRVSLASQYYTPDGELPQGQPRLPHGHHRLVVLPPVVDDVFVLRVAVPVALRARVVVVACARLAPAADVVGDFDQLEDVVLRACQLVYSYTSKGALT